MKKPKLHKEKHEGRNLEIQTKQRRKTNKKHEEETQTRNTKKNKPRRRNKLERSNPNINHEGGKPHEPKSP